MAQISYCDELLLLFSDEMCIDIGGTLILLHSLHSPLFPALPEMLRVVIFSLGIYLINYLTVNQ